MRFVLDALDDSTLERAGELVAREQTAARQSSPLLSVSSGDARVLTESLQRLLDAGGRGLLASHQGRPLAVMTAGVRDARPVGRYARLPAEGLAVDPDLDDPTAVLASLYRALAVPLVADGVMRHYLLHVAHPPLSEALANLGFARNGVYAVQAASPRPASSDVVVRVAGPQHLDTVAALALVELRHRAAAPMFGPFDERTLEDLLVEHRALHDDGVVHLLATLEGRDVGLLTVEPDSPAPRLCPPGQPYIGPTATVPDARGRGVGRALVDAALDRAHRHGYRWVSVDFEAANPLSRPFWLGAGFRPTGYGLVRLVDPLHRTRAD
ncbi:MAG TPA: GNAT family N-acetyltransferase [Candidatus Limnocylindrales bacterium]